MSHRRCGLTLTVQLLMDDAGLWPRRSPVAVVTDRQIANMTAIARVTTAAAEPAHVARMSGAIPHRAERTHIDALPASPSRHRRQCPAQARQPRNEEHLIAVAGRQVVRHGLVVVIAWIGALKYSAYEAAVTHPRIANSPLMSWLYYILSVRALAATLGTLEIIAAALIALHALSPRVSAVGSAMAILLFLGTLSFLFTTPAQARLMPSRPAMRSRFARS